MKNDARELFNVCGFELPSPLINIIDWSKSMLVFNVLVHFGSCIPVSNLIKWMLFWLNRKLQRIHHFVVSQLILPSLEKGINPIVGAIYNCKGRLV